MTSGVSLQDFDVNDHTLPFYHVMVHTLHTPVKIHLGSPCKEFRSVDPTGFGEESQAEIERFGFLEPLESLGTSSEGSGEHRTPSSHLQNSFQ